MPGWMKHKLESGFPGEISITSDTQMSIDRGMDKEAVYHIYNIQFSSVARSCLMLCDPINTRLPCPPPTSGA